MIITLYKNCIFNANYNEVCYCKLFKNKIPRDEYLNSLQKITFEIEDTFLEYNGHLNLNYYETNYNGNIFEFNYMKIQNNINENNGFIGYYFIKDIIIRNDIVLLDYSLDVWHTFSSTMNIYNSYLTNCSKINDYRIEGNVKFPYYRLPIDYSSNDNIIISPLIEGNFEEVQIIIQYQFFQTVQGGETGSRYSSLGKLATRLNHTTDIKETFTINEALTLINYILINRSNSDKYLYKQRILNGELIEKWFYEITNIYIIPAVYGELIETNEITYTGGGSLNPDEYVYRNYSCAFSYKDDNNIRYDNMYFAKEIKYKGETKVFYRTDIQNSFKNIRIGTLFQNKEIFPNGTTIKLHLDYYCDIFTFKIIGYIENEIIDFTNSFKFNIPYDSISGAENQQRKIGRIIDNFSNSFKIVSSLGTLGVMGTKGFSLTGSSISKRSGKEDINISRKSKHISKIFSSSQKREIDTYSYNDLFENGVSMLNGICDIGKINMPFNTSNGYTDVENDACLICATGGVGIFSMPNPDNEELVDNLINEIGYTVFYIGGNEILDDLQQDHLARTDFNTIKFEFVKLYGKFPQVIADKLSDILLNGVKIHYE